MCILFFLSACPISTFSHLWLFFRATQQLLPHIRGLQDCLQFQACNIYQIYSHKRKETFLPNTIWKISGKKVTISLCVLSKKLPASLLSQHNYLLTFSFTLESPVWAISYINTLPWRRLINLVQVSCCSGVISGMIKGMRYSDWPYLDYMLMVETGDME